MKNYNSLPSSNPGRETTPENDVARVTFREMDNFLLDNFSEADTKTQTELAKRAACEILGVYTGVKPAALTTIEAFKVADGEQNLVSFNQMLSQLGLVSITEHITDKRRYFISKDLDTAQELSATFHQLWEKPTDTKPIDDKLGLLLGYPKTAVLGQRPTSAERRRLDRKYPEAMITHTIEHAAEEYAAYEEKLLSALKEYCPKIWQANEQQKKRTLGQKISAIFNLTKNLPKTP